MTNLYKIHAVAYKNNIVMNMPFYIQAHNIQSAYSKALNFIKDSEIKHRLEIVAVIKELSLNT
jgi:hypothetical protein